MIINKPHISALAIAAMITNPASAAREGQFKQPDFTQGDEIPAKAKHDWNFGATGARGWVFSDKMVTTPARQIAVTKVEKGSPSDGTPELINIK
jgi:hypothetical protein